MDIRLSARRGPETSPDGLSVASDCALAYPGGCWRQGVRLPRRFLIPQGRVAGTLRWASSRCSPPVALARCVPGGAPGVHATARGRVFAGREGAGVVQLADLGRVVVPRLGALALRAEHAALGRLPDQPRLRWRAPWAAKRANGLPSSSQAQMALQLFSGMAHQTILSPVVRLSQC
jgi:hypothetical protein